jgi:hypothetical protein
MYVKCVFSHFKDTNFHQFTGPEEVAFVKLFFLTYVAKIYGFSEVVERV